MTKIVTKLLFLITAMLNTNLALAIIDRDEELLDEFLTNRLVQLELYNDLNSRSFLKHLSLEEKKGLYEIFA